MSINARIADARAESSRKLEKAMSYSPEFRKPAQIAFYIGHIAHLDRLARGEESQGFVADTAAWDVMQCEIDARSKSGVAS